MERITNAGGFVNAVGRINGNLNLSRYDMSVTFMCTLPDNCFLQCILYCCMLQLL